VLCLSPGEHRYFQAHSELGQVVILVVLLVLGNQDSVPA
jgi:hypothetical protein